MADLEWLTRPGAAQKVLRALQIRDKQGHLLPLVPNRAQREYERQATRRNLVLKARQLGITTYVAARFFAATVTRPGTVTVQVAHDQASAEQIFRIVHRFLANLPERARRGALVTSRANVRQLVFPLLDSEYRVETAADPDAGRGLTITNLHCSEVARWPRDAAATLASLRAAVVPQGEVVLESTANGAAGCFYDEWQRAEENSYTRHFFPWWYEPAYRIEGADAGELKEDEHELVRQHGLTREQIAFRRDLRANFRSLAPQEFAEDAASCFLASGECVFDVEATEARLRECTPACESRDSGRLRIWYPARRGREYILAADPAGGGAAGDYACAQVIERRSGLQCAELRGHLPPLEFAGRIAQLAREYNQALVAVERNNHGHAVLAHLQAAAGDLKIFEQHGQPGWLTNAQTRPPMIENFAALLAVSPQLFASATLLEECRTFVRQKNGSAAAAGGAHDDCVIAMAIAQMVRAEGAGRLSRNEHFAMALLPER